MSELMTVWQKVAQLPPPEGAGAGSVRRQGKRIAIERPEIESPKLSERTRSLPGQIPLDRVVHGSDLKVPRAPRRIRGEVEGKGSGQARRGPIEGGSRAVPNRCTGRTARGLRRGWRSQTRQAVWAAAPPAIIRSTVAAPTSPNSVKIERPGKPECLKAAQSRIGGELSSAPASFSSDEGRPAYLELISFTAIAWQRPVSRRADLNGFEGARGGARPVLDACRPLGSFTHESTPAGTPGNPHHLVQEGGRTDLERSLNAHIHVSKKIVTSKTK